MIEFSTDGKMVEEVTVVQVVVKQARWYGDCRCTEGGVDRQLIKYELGLGPL